MTSSTSSQSLILTRPLARTNIINSILSISLGVILLGVLSKISIPLRPIPVTGQTFGVLLIAHLYGRKLGFATVITYLAAGLIGLPVFAAVTGGLSVGYLIGMAVAAYVVGYFADLGWTKSFTKSLVAGYIGSLFIFGFGLLVLSFFIPSTSELLAVGFYPFLIGNMIKIVLAAFCAQAIHKKLS